MGRHVNDGKGLDEGGSAEQETARHAASGAEALQTEAGQLLEPQAVISSDTHVGVDFDELAPDTQDAEPSPAHPDALVEHGEVGDGHELE